jgi:mycofactocin glycosyltransferase
VTSPVPRGFGLILDSSAKQLADDLWFGGSPPRVLRLSATGRRAWDELQRGPVVSTAGAELARRLTDCGIAHPVPPAPSVPADLTVLVPVFGRAAQLDRCLCALGTRYPVVVVDDGSRDAGEIAKLAAQHGAQLVRREVNGGPAAARMDGLAEVRTEFVAFLDSDCEPPHGWLDQLTAHLADPMVAAAAPQITALAGDGWAGRYTRARGALDLGGVPARVAPGTRVSYVPTAALVTRRAALLDVGGFDMSLRVGEDVDLIWRLHAAGWRIRYDPSVHVAHREPASWPALLARRYRYGTSAAALARRHGNAVAPLVLHPWPALAVAGVLTRRPSVAAAGIGAAALSTTRTLHRANVPTAGLWPAVARAVLQSWLGTGRYATQLAAPVVLAAARAHGRRLAAASLLLGPAVAAWLPKRRALDPARFIAGAVVDEIAYGAGVWAGCIRERNLAAVRPVVVRRGFRIGERP